MANDKEKGCSVEYVSDYLKENESSYLLNVIPQICKNVTSLKSRATYWYSNKPYSYGNISHPPCAMNDLTLNALIERISKYLGVEYNSVLINFYSSGDDYIPYHSDDEHSISCSKIASISLGATRLFSFLPKYTTETSHHIYLKSGSLLVMDGNTQSHWMHSLIKEPHIQLPRINLTFRMIQ